MTGVIGVGNAVGLEITNVESCHGGLFCRRRTRVEGRNGREGEVERVGWRLREGGYGDWRRMKNASSRAKWSTA